ncbi:hypothetical protein [Acinetobacter boissieri]|uniref:DUF3649 domain-containing protein n=1 Tax=Acinetobacter boissieri TaxID=1219383 RepID=A0A1G6IG12_9GAMM|nr:hypothetical protein [Acinetobacter boissieri]SDC04686.1 hypothetical protein SAMN05421733_10882 [Acinetobacter boissieri]
MKSTIQKYKYAHQINVLYRTLLSCVVGYFCVVYFSLCLAAIFLQVIPRAEAVFLAIFCAIIFALIFFIACFSIQSIQRLSLLSFGITLLFYGLSYLIG